MSRFLTKKGVLFHHIPHTGGTWVEQAISSCNLGCRRWLNKQPGRIPKKHALLSHYERKWKPMINYVFAFVRHPLAYYESTWKWLRNKQSYRRLPYRLKVFHQTWHPQLTAARQWQPEFNDWVYLMWRNEPCWYTRLIESYVGPEGGEFCDFIGRTESLVDDWFHAMSVFGYGEEVEPHEQCVRTMGRVNTLDADITWSSDLQAKILESERLVIRRFYGTSTRDRRWYAQLAEKGAAPVVA